MIEKGLKNFGNDTETVVNENQNEYILFDQNEYKIIIIL